MILWQGLQPLGKITALCKPPSWTWLPLVDGDRNGRIRKGKDRKKREAMKREERWIGPQKGGLIYPQNVVAPGIVGWLCA